MKYDQYGEGTMELLLRVPYFVRLDPNIDASLSTVLETLALAVARTIGPTFEQEYKDRLAKQEVAI